MLNAIETKLEALKTKRDRLLDVALSPGNLDARKEALAQFKVLDAEYAALLAQRDSILIAAIG